MHHVQLSGFVDYAQRVRAGAWLKARREEHGFRTAASFARALGVDPSMVSNYERGANAIDDERAAQIAAVLGVSEIDVRRKFGLWVPAEEERPISTLEAIEQDPALDDEARKHFRNQYQLLTALTEYRRQSGAPPDQEIPIEEQVLAETTADAEEVHQARRRSAAGGR